MPYDFHRRVELLVCAATGLGTYRMERDTGLTLAQAVQRVAGLPLHAIAPANTCLTYEGRRLGYREITALEDQPDYRAWAAGLPLAA